MTELPSARNRRAAIGAALCAAVALAALPARAGDGGDGSGAARGDEPAAAGEPAATGQPALPWRDDPAVLRHPGSYLGGIVGYANLRAWLPENDQHDALFIGPLNTWMIAFRVGDAFLEWFAVGFQIDISNNTRGETGITVFDLMLDVTFYPWQGLGIRPSVGLGLGYAYGREDWELGGGGPGAVALAALYEIRVTRLFVLAPVVQVVYVGGEEFDALAVFAGIEILKWFATATG